MMNLSKNGFVDKINSSDKPIMVKFWAPWCVYCRRIETALDKLSERYGEKVVFGKVNIDEHPKIAEEEGIEVIPTLVLYSGGNKVASIVAPDSMAIIEKFLTEGMKKI